MQADNIILIGMPASGKSTAGVLLAKTLGYNFVDCDLLIQGRENALLCDGDYAPAIRRLRTEPGLAGALVANARRDIPVLRWSRIAGLFDTLFRALIAERGEASCAADRTTP